MRYGNIFDKVEKYVESSKDYATELLADMISIPTVVPPGENYGRFADYARDVLKDAGLKVQVFKVPKNVLNRYIPEMSEYPRYIVFARYGSGKPVLHFNGHYDVVPAGGGWRYNPFEATVKNNRIYGRGAADMKGGIVSMITAVKTLINLEAEINGTIEISLTPDEEIGGVCGAKYLLDLIDVPNWAVIAEPSDCSKIWIGHKGVIWFEVEVSGKAAHASTPEEGINAVEYCVKIANRLMRLKSEIENRVTAFECNVKNATLAITHFEGGLKVNVIPDKAILRLDRRVLPEETLENAIKELVDAVSFTDHSVKVHHKVLFSAKPMLNKDSIVASKIESLLKNADISPVRAISSGFMDTRFFVEAGSDAVAFGPGNISQAHSSDEFVEIDKLTIASKVFAKLALELLTSHQRSF